MTILDLKGKITLGEGDEVLKDKINSLVHQNRKRILLNLEGVPYIDSAGLGEIVRTYTTVSRQGGQLKLVNLTKRITDLLPITKLSRCSRPSIPSAKRLKSYSLAREITRRAPAGATYRSGPASSRSILGRRQSGRWPELVLSLRPSQWTKNLFVFAGLIFAEKLRDLPGGEATLAFAIFCLLSGVVYLINDVNDREADRRHPVKSHRPIASGASARRAALTAAAVLGSRGAGRGVCDQPPFGSISLGIWPPQHLLGLAEAHRHHRCADARGRLRAAGGRRRGGDQRRFSHWLLLLMLLLALFLALSKRRAELVTLADDAAAHRRILAEYSPYLLDQMIGVVTASTLLAYAFYTISPETVQKFGTDRLIWTVPFPLYGIFRYLYLVHQRAGGGNPSDTLLEDRPLLACVALWGVMVIVILYGPGR